MSLLLRHLESHGLLAPADLEVATRRQQSAGGSLDTALLELGLLSPTQLDDALREACGLPGAPVRLLERGPTRPWDHVPRDLVDIGWAIPLALENGQTIVAVHPDLPDARLGQLYRQIRGFHPVVAPECCLAKVAAERSGAILSPRYALVVLDYLQALRRRDSGRDEGDEDAPTVLRTLRGPVPSDTNPVRPGSGKNPSARPLTPVPQNSPRSPAAAERSPVAPAPQDSSAPPAAERSPVAPAPQDSSAPPAAERPPVAPAPRDTSAPPAAERPPVAPAPRDTSGPAAAERTSVAPAPRDTSAPPAAERPSVAPAPRDASAPAAPEGGPASAPAAVPRPSAVLSPEGARVEPGSSDSPLAGAARSPEDAGPRSPDKPRTAAAPGGAAARAGDVQRRRSGPTPAAPTVVLPLSQRLTAARATLAGARERDRITEALVRAAAIIAPRVGLFGVKREGLRVLAAPGSALRLTEGLVIPLPEGGQLDRAVTGQAPLTLLTEPSLSFAVGQPLGIPCVFEPVLAGGRTVLMLYLDRAGVAFDPAERAALRELCDTARQSLEALLRLLGWVVPTPAPATDRDAGARPTLRPHLSPAVTLAPLPGDLSSRPASTEPAPTITIPPLTTRPPAADDSPPSVSGSPPGSSSAALSLSGPTHQAGASSPGLSQSGAPSPAPVAPAGGLSPETSPPEAAAPRDDAIEPAAPTLSSGPSSRETRPRTALIPGSSASESSGRIVVGDLPTSSPFASTIVARKAAELVGQPPVAGSASAGGPSPASSDSLDPGARASASEPREPAPAEETSTGRPRGGPRPARSARPVITLVNPIRREEPAPPPSPAPAAAVEPEPPAATDPPATPTPQAPAAAGAPADHAPTTREPFAPDSPLVARFAAFAAADDSPDPDARPRTRGHDSSDMSHAADAGGRATGSPEPPPAASPAGARGAPEAAARSQGEPGAPAQVDVAAPPVSSTSLHRTSSAVPSAPDAAPAAPPDGEPRPPSDLQPVPTDTSPPAPALAAAVEADVASPAEPAAAAGSPSPVPDSPDSPRGTSAMSPAPPPEAAAQGPAAGAGPDPSDIHAAQGPAAGAEPDLSDIHAPQGPAASAEPAPSDIPAAQDPAAGAEPAPSDSSASAPIPPVSTLNMPNLIAPPGKGVGRRRAPRAPEPVLVIPKTLRRSTSLTAAPHPMGKRSERDDETVAPAPPEPQGPPTLSIPSSLINPRSGRRRGKHEPRPEAPPPATALNMPRLVREPAPSPASESMSESTGSEAPAPEVVSSAPASAPPEEVSGDTLPPPDTASPEPARPRDEDPVEAALEAYLQAPDEANLARLRALDAAGLARLVARFPGPIDLANATNFPPPSAHGPLLRACVALGEAVTLHVLELLKSPRPQIRFYAAFLFQELRDPRCMRSLAELSFDSDPDVRLIATRVLESYSRAPEFTAVAARVRAELDSADRERQLLAAEAAGTLRDTLAVPRLIDLLAVREKHLREAALEALCSITAKHHGYRAARWRSWYAEHGHESRVEWVMDGLRHRDVAVRRWAADELVRVTGERIVFPTDGDRRARDLALRQWLDWWDAHKHEFPGRA